MLFVAEDREILFHPAAGEIERERYSAYYSTARLRRLAEQRVGTRHADLFAGLRLVMEALGRDNGCPELGLPALGSFLFSREAVADIVDCEIANRDLLDAVRSLAFTDDRYSRRVVDYRNLGAEELGSVYESLLELHPVLNIEAAKFELTTASGHERKTTGSYYTPTSLINCLLDSALDPVLDEAEKQPDPETAILSLKVCDPACGSGHFLIAAAHRIARRLASVRTGDEEPAPSERRKALRDVVGRCIYGVDINPMAVELCKVSLWMEAIEPGKPLSFLEQHIQCGNSLLGATPALLANGIPDSAFEAIEGDDKKICSEYKKKNKYQREGNRTLFDPEGQPWERLGDLAGGMMQLDDMRDDTVEDIHRKQDYYAQLVKSSGYEFGRLWADAWCAAFVWKKTSDFAYPITEDVFRNIEKNPHNIASWMKAEIIRLREQYQFFHWHLAFPDVFRVPAKNEEPENEQAGWSGGFDVVLGNPPWERIKIQEKEWFAQRNPDIANAANAAQRRRMIAALQYDNPATYNAFMEDQRQAEGEGHFVRDSNHYPLCGRGDINTYAIFAENMRFVIGSAGRVGCIVPSGIATDDTTKYFFQNLMETQSLFRLYDFENRNGVFPGVHRSYKFCLLTMVGSARPATKGAEFVFFALKAEDLQDEYRRFTLNSTDISLLNPNTKTCPIFRSKRDAELNKAIYDRAPVLINVRTEKNFWGAYYMRLIHLSDHSRYLRFPWEEQSSDWDVPLYEAKLFNAFDHRYCTFAGTSPADCIAGQPRELSDVEKINADLSTSPRYFLPRNLARDLFAKYPLYRRPWLLLWRGVARSTDERTCITTIIPKVLASVKCPALGFNSIISPTVLVGNLNSLVFDYTVRQKIGGVSLSYFIFKQLPVLTPEYL